MLEPVFGNKNVEKVLFFILKNDHCYGRDLSRIFDQALSPLQNALDRLEEGGILVSFLIGKTRMYQFNPRYPFLKEIKELLIKSYAFLPSKTKLKYYESKIRKRPRKKGKPL